MKVATQEFAAAVNHSLFPPSQSWEFDLTSICKLQLEQLTAGLNQTVAVWLIYSDTYIRADKSVTYDAANTVYLSHIQLLQEERLAENFLSFKVIELSCNELGNTYICCLGKHRFQDTEHPAYILIYTNEYLSHSEQQLVLDCAQLLNHHLTIHRQLSEKTAEVASLAQALGRGEHQLRNPLALIKLTAENLRLKLSSEDLQQQAVFIKETAEQLGANLTNLLYYGQRTQQRLEIHDLGSIVADSIESIQPWIEEKNIQICCTCQKTLVAVDSWQMKQVFDNLLSNAVYFSPKNGVISCNWQVYCNEVLIQISDNGSGISEQDLKLIFKPYHSRRPGGTGLGLSIAQKIILDHKGSIWVENLAEGGAQFSFTLPI